MAHRERDVRPTGESESRAFLLLVVVVVFVCVDVTRLENFRNFYA